MRESVFFRGVVPGKPTMLLWMAPHPCVCEQQLLNSVLQEKKDEKEEGREDRIWGVKQGWEMKGGVKE